MIWINLSIIIILKEQIRATGLRARSLARNSLMVSENMLFLNLYR
jgi:hypothetical protein